MDQARDLGWSDAIVASGERPIVGPLMRGRVHLGPTYYYFWSLPRWVSDQPAAANRFAGLLGVLAVLGAYGVGSRVAGPGCGLAAAALLATSPTAVIDGRVAWAPAAVPFASGAFLWATVHLLRRPRAWLAFVVMAVAGSATQLHLSTAPWSGVGAVAVGLRRRALGLRGVAWAVFGLAIAIAPMGIAWRADSRVEGRAGGDRAVVDADPGGPQPAAESSEASRARIELAAGGKAPALQVLWGRARAIPGGFAAPLEGTTRLGFRTRAVETLLVVEPVIALLSLLVGLALLIAPARLGADVDPARVVAGAAWLSTVAVILLPGEAWSYYLDGALLPLAICFAVMLVPARAPAPSWRLAGGALVLILLVTLRVVGLSAWRIGLARDGHLSVDLRLWNLDQRDAVVGGGTPARVATLRAKQEAVTWIVDRIGPDLSRLRSRVHGPGSGDLDSDNGALFRRAAARAATSPGSRSADSAGTHILVLTREDLRLAGPVDDVGGTVAEVGPWRLVAYAPRADGERAWLEGCATSASSSRAEIPRWVPGDARDYGHGEPVMPRWACSEPTLVVPVAVAPGASGPRSLRVFVRPVGGVEVGSIAVEPPSELVAELAQVAGSGPGVVLRGERPAVVRAGLRVDGPGFADVWELPGPSRP